MYMNDIKMFAKNGQEWEIIMHALRICNQDIGMEFGTEIAPF